MLLAMFARRGAIFALVVLTGCASLPPRIDQRATLGPTAKQMFTFRMTAQNGREPTFEEMSRWQDQMDQLISRYLAEHPEVANAMDVFTFRYERQVGIGMSKEQVLILMGAPVQVTADAAEIEKLAGRFAAQIKGNATEVWVYPVGWRLFFAGQRVVDITQFVPSF